MSNERKLYYITNLGEGVAQCIAEFNEVELTFFLKIIKNLNLNSYYSWQPWVAVQEASWDMFEEYIPNDNVSDWRNREEEHFYFEGKIYVTKERWFDPKTPNLEEQE